MPAIYVRLVMSLMMVALGVAMVRPRRGARPAEELPGDPRRSRSGADTLRRTMGAILLVLGVVGVGWSFFGEQIKASTLAQVADIRRAQVDEVRAVEIQAYPADGATPPLTSREVRITDRAVIEQIVQGLRTARPWDASGPKPQWTCLLVLEYPTRKAYCTVTATSDNGVLVNIYSHGYQGTVLGEYRGDALGAILQAAASAGEGSPEEEWPH